MVLSQLSDWHFVVKNSSEKRFNCLVENTKSSFWYLRFSFYQQTVDLNRTDQIRNLKSSKKIKQQNSNDNHTCLDLYRRLIKGEKNISCLIDVKNGSNEMVEDTCESVI